MRIAIITGASAGLGRDFALQLDAAGGLDEIWLVARRVAPMQALAGEFQHARGRIFGVDLTDTAALRAFVDEARTVRPEIVWLVNNAGFGALGEFASIGAERHLEMIDLNVRALTELTQRLLPFCIRGSHIVQVASSAGFIPMPGFAVYAATKAYVVSLSQALANELAPRAISVTAVCPGPVETEFLEVATGEAGRRPRGPVVARSGDVVRKALADARRGRRLSVYGTAIGAFVAVSGLIPRRLAAWAAGRSKARQLR